MLSALTSTTDANLCNKKLLVQAGPCLHRPEGKWIPKTGEFRAIDIAPPLIPILRRLIKGKADSAFVIEIVHCQPFTPIRGCVAAFAERS